MSLTLGVMENFEAFLATQITAVPALAGLNVLVAPEKNLLQEINLRILKLAVVIVPHVYQASDDSSGIQGTMFDDTLFSVTTFFNPKITYGGLSCRSIAETIAATLKGDTGWPRNIELLKPTIRQVYDPDLNVYEVRGRVPLDGTIIPSLPAITGAAAGGNVTLANAQPGAAIFYRTDGNLPTVADALYTGPFASAGQKIRARAWLPGYIGSPYFSLQT